MSMMPSRLGRRALVTRPRAEAAALAEALAMRGIEAIIEPLLDIHSRDEHTPDLAGVQAVLCTSANGIRALARLSGERRIAVFAVGEATAARARDAGFARVESAGGNVEDLARLARQLLRPDAGRLLHVAGSDVAGDLAGMLHEDGFAVDRVVLYEARPVPGLSAPTVAAFARLAERAGVGAALRTVTGVSISAAADRGLSDLAFRDRQVADTPDQNGLL